MNVGILADRVMGKYPLSIATSLAIEGAIGEHEEHPTGKNELILYDQIWVNIKTIFRNLYNSVDRELVETVPHVTLYEQVEVEADQFQRVIDSETKGQMKVVFYVSDYAGMERAYPHSHLRGDTTVLQKTYTSAMIGSLAPYVRNHQEDLKTFKLKITGSSDGKSMLLTHYPLDLICKGFRELVLLESHTGTVKHKHQWYTKYLNGSTIPTIPFNEQFIQVFGDKEHFRPTSINIRKAVLDLATQYNWSQVTTRDKLVYDIGLLKDHFLKDNLLQLFRS
jgi:hypothetical protein